MTEHKMKIEGLPEGDWMVTKIRVSTDCFAEQPDGSVVYDANLYLEKIQPRRIVLEETEEVDFLSKGEWFISLEGNFIQWNSPNRSKTVHIIWREVKETDIPLTNDEPNVKMGVSQGDGETKLELNVKELRNVRSLIKDFENLGWFINPERALLLQKITEFIKDK